MEDPLEDSDYILNELFSSRRQELVSHIPHAIELALEVVDASPSNATIRLPVTEHLVGDSERGVVFGGVITTLLDQVGGAAVMCGMRELSSIATIDLRIDYLKAATPGRDLFGHAECYRMTRSVAFVRGAAYHDSPDDPFAIFVSTYMLAANPLPPSVFAKLEKSDA
ncbi:MAG: hypothetical protein ACI8TX_000691 [Hyphomicrobiaceae bacterium]|jgi:uncharacterized protein (TIGR00369 family)